MSEPKIPQIPDVEREHSTTTRSAALRESLQARRSPVPPREFSTLVERSEPRYTPCPYPDCGCENEPGSELIRGDFIWPENVSLALVDALAINVVTAARPIDRPLEPGERP